MKRTLGISLMLIISAALLIFCLWPFSNDIRHYTEAELEGLTCAELSEKHDEVITAYHDASIAHFHRTGAFEDGIGLPDEGTLPIIIVMKHVIRDRDFAGFDLSKPFFNSASATAPKRHSDFYAEISSICATYPAMDAVTAVMQAAKNLDLPRKPSSLE